MADLPSVPFLNPIGKETPDASSRWSWDSVVRAPIAPQEITLKRKVRAYFVTSIIEGCKKDETGTAKANLM